MINNAIIKSVTETEVIVERVARYAPAGLMTIDVMNIALLKHVIGMGLIVVMIFVLKNVWLLGLVIPIVTWSALMWSAASMEEIVCLMRILNLFCKQTA